MTQEALSKQNGQGSLSARDLEELALSQRHRAGQSRATP